MRKSGSFLILLVSAICISILVSNAAALPIGLPPNVNVNVGASIPGNIVQTVNSLTAAPDQRIFGATSYTALAPNWSHLFYWHANCTGFVGQFYDLGDFGPIGMHIYALTTSMCFDFTDLYYPFTERDCYAIWGGSAPATYNALGAHLFRYVPYKYLGPDPSWSPGIAPTSNPRDYGPVYTIAGWPAGLIPSVPKQTQIYQLASGPCGKIYGGLGYSPPGAGVGACTFFVFDPVTGTILLCQNYAYPWDSIVRVSDGRDGRVYFIRWDTTSTNSMLACYDPITNTFHDLLSSSWIPANGGPNVGVFTDLTWSVDYPSGDPRIYLSTNLGYLIEVDPDPYIPPFPYPYAYKVLGQIYPSSSPGPLNILCLTTGMFDQVYGGATDGTNAYFFMFEVCCKGWNPGPASNAPNIFNPVTFPALPQQNVYSICYGQESRSGGSVNNKDPRIYFGTGNTAATTMLYCYLPLTPDINRDCKVDIKDIAREVGQFGMDPPSGSQSSNLSMPVLGLLLVAGISAAIAATSTARLYKIKKSKRK